MGNDLDHGLDVYLKPPKHLDYSLTGENSKKAIERGLAEADWYQCHVPRETMRELLERRDGPAIRDTIIWFALITGSGIAARTLWPSPWFLAPYLIYAVLYASTSDSRWHEAGHGTAFKTDWMNNVLYEIASFMVMRESTVWRWSHTRHHSDTIIVGRDPEISVPRPPNIRSIILKFFGLPNYPRYFKSILKHSFSKISKDEKTFIPESEYPKIIRKARIYVGIYLSVLCLALWMWSLLPLLFIGLPNLFGSWLMHVYAHTQHAGLAENVLDHRLNCRTVYMGPIHRFLYWNMNYHIEHHMFPLVPYHALPRLHDEVKDDCPPPYPGLIAAWREIIPAIFKQVKDPTYHVKRKLPALSKNSQKDFFKSEEPPDKQGWVEVCEEGKLLAPDVIRFDHGRKTYAIYRNEEGTLYATDGICTHGNTHLSDGLVKGNIIECPKHNGRFNLVDGSPARTPVCRGLSTYPVEEKDGRLFMNVLQEGGSGVRDQKTYQYRVVSNKNVSTFIKELVIEPLSPEDRIGFAPGDYLQFEIPAYEKIYFREFDIPEPYATVWKNQHLFDLEVGNEDNPVRRNNYSIATNQSVEKVLRFNIRIATPPPGQDCPPGVGSSFMFWLKEGDQVSAIGPFGDFHIKPTHKEMVYIGGGAGMAPLRAHLSHLFETEKTARKISFWYGARSRQEIYYDDYFNYLEKEYSNFSFHLALSSPLPEDEWDGHRGFIHEVAHDQYLENHPDPKAVEYYLCGPPMMIRACMKMLSDLGVEEHQISFDEF
jgi:Na+-transporting NADH:ubiquinone oxidoreductase subunit F